MSSSDTKTIADFGYGFNDKGQLRQLDPETGAVTDKLFQFEISDSRSTNQKNYEALGETITPFVYELLDKHGLHRISLPEGRPESQATFIFSSKKQLKDVDKLMVIIHGSGVVRAGQWARSLIINHSLDAGTVLPYVKKAQADGYEVIITNTNDNYGRDGRRIPGNGSPEEHANTVWEEIVQPAKAKSIAVVAHSYGGHVAVDLSRTFKDDFDKRVFAVALTDSVHSSRGAHPRLQNIGINFVSSDKPLGSPERSGESDIPRFSAGTPKHEMTSYSCIEKLFEFIQKRYKEEHEGEADAGEHKEVAEPVIEEIAKETIQLERSPEVKKAKTEEL